MELENRNPLILRCCFASIISSAPSFRKRTNKSKSIYKFNWIVAVRPSCSLRFGSLNLSSLQQLTVSVCPNFHLRLPIDSRGNQGAFTLNAFWLSAYWNCVRSLFSLLRLSPNCMVPSSTTPTKISCPWKLAKIFALSRFPPQVFNLRWICVVSNNKSGQLLFLVRANWTRTSSWWCGPVYNS